MSSLQSRSFKILWLAILSLAAAPALSTDYLANRLESSTCLDFLLLKGQLRTPEKTEQNWLPQQVAEIERKLDYLNSLFEAGLGLDAQPTELAHTAEAFWRIPDAYLGSSQNFWLWDWYDIGGRLSLKSEHRFCQFTVSRPSLRHEGIVWLAGAHGDWEYGLESIHFRNGDTLSTPIKKGNRNTIGHSMVALDRLLEKITQGKINDGYGLPFAISDIVGFERIHNHTFPFNLFLITRDDLSYWIGQGFSVEDFENMSGTNPRRLLYDYLDGFDRKLKIQRADQIWTRSSVVTPLHQVLTFERTELPSLDAPLHWDGYRTWLQEVEAYRVKRGSAIVQPAP